MARIGDIASRLTIDNRNFEKGLKDARKQTQTFSQKAGDNFNSLTKTIGKMKVAFAGFIAAIAVRGAFRAITESIDKLDKLGDTAAKIGISTDALQELRYAASQVNVEQSALDMGLQRFTRRLGEARKGTGELKDTLLDANIALVDQEGRARSTEDVLADYADAIQNAGDEAEQLRMAFKGFDSEGAALVNVLRDGSSGLRRFADEARAAGLVVNENLIRQAGDAGDKLSTMRQVVSTQLTVALAQLAPTITAVGNAFVNSLPGLIAWIDGFMRLENQSTTGLKAQLEDMTNELNKIPENKNINVGINAFDMLDSTVAQNAARRKELEKEILTIKNEIWHREREMLAAQGRQRKELERQQELAQQSLEDKQKELEKKQEVEEYMRKSELARKERLAAVKNELKGISEELDRQIAAEEAALEKYLNMADPYRQVREELEMIARLAEEFPEHAEELAKAGTVILDSVGDIGDETKEVSEAADSMAIAFTTAFDDAIMKGGDLGDVLDGLLKTIIQLIARMLILEPLEDGLRGFFGGMGLTSTNTGKAGGGTIGAGITPVGERGLEYIVSPGGGGTKAVTAQAAGAMGGGQEIKVEIVNRGTPQRATGTQTAQGPDGAIIKIITDDLEKGGATSNTMQRLFDLRRRG